MSAIGYTPHPDPAPPKSSPPPFGRTKMQIDDLTQEPVRQFFRNDYSPYCTIICTWRGLTRPQTPAERVVEAAMRLWRMEVQFKGVKISTEQIMQFRAAIEEFDQARSALEARSAS